MESTSSSVLRVLDANVDRCREGLRVLEDVARFVLDDAFLSASLRDLRHRVTQAASYLGPGLMNARRAQEDVGASLNAPQQPLVDLTELLTANSKRVQEGLRVLEEFARLPDLARQLDGSWFKSARFTVYDHEQRLVGRVLRLDKVQKLKGVYFILDPTTTQGRPEIQVAEEALAGGASVLQLRDKMREKGIQLNVALALRELCHRHEALFIVNNDPDLALAVDADGVHLGQRDFPLRVARQILPLDRIIGISAATYDEAHQADVDGADYIAVGSIYPTQSKEDTRPAGLETLRRVRGLTKRPLVAIGGIDVANIEAVLDAGADSVAVISAIASADDPKLATEQLVESFRRRRGADSGSA